MNVPYQEQSINTSNTKLAAALLTFGLRLVDHHPIFLCLEWSFKDLKAGRKRSELKPVERFSFNFVRNDQSAAIAQAFEGRNAQEQFEAFLTGELAGTLSPDQINKLRDLHSNALAQTCREVQEAREYLLDMLKPSMPREAKWGLIRRSEKSYALFPLSAPKETVEQLIRKLEDEDRRNRNGQ
jgi:hypothetical protein